MRADSPRRLTAWRRSVLDQLLDHFLDLEETERAASLARFGDRYPRLHVWLSQLLAASDTPTEQFGAAVSRTAERAVTDREALPGLAEGTLLGPWRILGQAGRGGMGVVYKAERGDGAFEMSAAIKLIRSQRDALADRLVQERQLLARLNHPGISRLIDGGLTDSGQAYLVMEWVPGEDLSEANRTGVDPLQTTCEVADALTHAHQRMVVHGDIKPGNIRIGPRGRARLLDFGVARLLAEERDEGGESLIALTPTFAAPELLQGQAATAQSDIWALGAVLAWLLTGQRPPGDGSIVLPEALNHPRSADLMAVIGTACADDPTRRYDSVAAFADDLRRIRSHRPVLARPAGPLQRLRLWSRRNPLAAGLAGLLALGAVAGTSILGWQAQVVRAERDLARFENTRWEAMRDQLVQLFGLVALEADSAELGARDLLDGSVSRLDQLLAEDDRGRAYIESMLGSLYVALQDYQSAASVLRRFVESDDGSSAAILRSDAYGNLALAEAYLGNHARALKLVDQALAMVERQPGDYRRRLSELHGIRGSALRGLGEWSASIEALERAVALARAADSAPNRTLASAHNNLGVTLINAGRSDEARLAFEDSLSNWRALGLDESSDALTVLGNLATIYHQQGDLPAAEAAYAEAIERRRQRYGDSAALAAAMNNYGQVLIIRHRLDQARDQLEQATDMMGRFNGETSPHYAIVLRSLGLLALTAGDVDQASEHFSQAESILLDTVGPEHLFTVIVQAQAARVLARRDPAAAVERLDEVIEMMAGLGPPAAPHKAGALCEQSVLLLDLGRPESARAVAERCLDIRQDRLALEHWETIKAEALLAAAAVRLGDPRAEEILVASVETLADTYGPGHPRRAWLESRLSQ